MKLHYKVILLVVAVVLVAVLGNSVINIMSRPAPPSAEEVARNSQSESLKAWQDLETVMASMREMVIKESKSPLEVTDGIEYLVKSLHSSIAGTLSAFSSTDVLQHFSTQRPLTGCPNPDQDYWTSPLDPNGFYRIYGDLGGTVFLTAVLYGYVPAADELLKGWGSTLESFIDTRDIEIAEDGKFELFISAARPEGAKNWLQMTANVKEIMIREFHHDRSKEAGAKLKIERIDQGVSSDPSQQVVSARQMVSASEFANGPLTDQQVAGWLGRITTGFHSLLEFRKVVDIVGASYGIVGANQPVVVTMENAVARQAQPNPLVNYVNIQVELEDGETMLIEGRPPETLYWSVAFCDRWMSSPGGRQTGWLNDSEVILEDDGSYRVVVGPQDPGAKNWIDTSGHLRGALLWRFVSGEHVPKAPTVRIVRTEDL